MRMLSHGDTFSPNKVNKEKKEVIIMQRLEFISLCESLTIDWGIAVENEGVRQALLKGDDDEVKRILAEEF